MTKTAFKAGDRVRIVLPVETSDCAECNEANEERRVFVVDAVVGDVYLEDHSCPMDPTWLELVSAEGHRRQHEQCERDGN